MKVKLLSAVLLFASITTAIGQPYKISPSKTLNVSTPYDKEGKFEINFENISTATITLKWKLISNNLVAGWESYMCDNTSCCQGVPTSGTMYYIDPGIEVYLALNVDAKAISGNGSLKLYVYEENDVANGDTLTWNVNAAAVGVNALELDSRVKVFPNPAVDYVMVDLTAYPSKAKNTLAVYSGTGQKLTEQIATSTIEKLDLTTFPKGIYKVVIQLDGNQITKTIVK